MKNHLHFYRVFTTVAAALCAVPFIPSCQAAPLTIAAQGQSTFSIVVPKVAAKSVNEAATELQRDIAEATGAKLPIVKDDAAVAGAFISLGSTRQAQAAGISAQGIADEEFRIVTKNGKLFIIGLDTTAEDIARQQNGIQATMEYKVKLHPEIPGPAFTKNGGFSDGTANGVYSFLEDQLGVRWLMPGDIGRDVPAKSTFTVDEMDRTTAPLFNYRALMLAERTPNGFEWGKRQRLGYSFRVNHDHAWENIVDTALYKDHPDWFAMNAGGKRPDPKNNANFKLETTNPALVKYIADKAVAALKEHPAMNTFSITPTDSLGYSQSPESLALYDKDVINANGPSMTPLILKFYQDVAALVAKEYPQGKVAGTFYQQFVNPPSQGGVKIPENFVPVLISTANDYRFYNKEMQAANSANLNAWGKIAPETWYYYAHPNWLRYDGEATINPAAPANWNLLFRDLVKNHIKGAFLYGKRTWSQSALSNYIAAKMLWDPNADAVALQRDWLTRAYGPQAGAIMEEFYNKMDESWFSDYYRLPNSTGNQLSALFFSEIYGKHYPQMEALLLKAEAQTMTPAQKERLRFISDNLRVLQWRLRNGGMLPADYKSPYTISTQQVFALMSDQKYSDGVMRLSIGLPANGYAAVTKNVKVRIGNPEGGSAAKVPNQRLVLLYPTADGEARLKLSNVKAGCSFLYYFVHNDHNIVIQQGLLDNGEEITFPVKANTPYYLETNYRGVNINPQISWNMTIPNAIPAQATAKENEVYLASESKNKKARATYVYVPGNLNWVVTESDAGLVIQEPDAQQKKSDERNETRQAAVATLETALKKHNGTLVRNLNEGWKFSIDPEKTGLQQGFEKPEFDDSSWKPMSTIGPWQANGFENYHGTAWYRKKIKLSQNDVDPVWLSGKKLMIFVGAVDGDAVFYLNGEKIGERRQADYFDSWQVPFALDVANAVIAGDNILSVQVTKDKFAAGLYKGVSLIAAVPEKK